MFNVLDFKFKTGEISKGISKNIKEKQNLELNLGSPICTLNSTDNPKSDAVIHNL